MKTEVEYVRESNGNYMLIHGTKQVDCYEMKVVECNAIPGLLPLTMQRVNNQSTYMYLITNRISMSELYRREPPGAGEINAFLNSLKEALTSLANYLLRPDGLLLDAEHIFVDKNTKKVAFAYYENEEGDFFGDLKRLFEDCLLQTVDHGDNEAVTLVYGTYKRLCNNNCSIQGLFEVEETQEEEYSIRTESRIEPSVLPEKTDEEEEVRDRGRYVAVIVGMAAVAVLGINGFLACAIPGMRYGGFAPAVYAVFGLCCFVGDFFWLRWFRENRCLFVKTVKKQVVIPYEEEKVRISIPKPQTPPEEEGTVILNLDRQAGIPKLRWSEDNATKEWPVFQDTVIGSSAAKADCVINRPGISRMHAKIICLPDHSGFYIKDLNSTNSTSVDGNLLNPFELRPLNGKEKIRLGNVEVDFVI